jgi:HEAT repeat protein
MEKKDNQQHQRLLAALQSDDAAAVGQAIDDLKASGDASLIPELLKLLAESENEAVLQQVSQLLFDLKDPKALDVLIDHLTDTRFADIRTQMLEACWQCGLDTSHRLPTLLNVAITGSYLEILEVLTIIENWDGMSDQLTLREELHRFKDAMSELEISEAEDLMLSIVEVLNGFVHE